MAQFFSVHALLFVSYPTQVLAKSCKPIPGNCSIQKYLGIENSF